jgi:hypothetical protein
MMPPQRLKQHIKYQEIMKRLSQQQLMRESFVKHFLFYPQQSAQRL